MPNEALNRARRLERDLVLLLVAVVAVGIGLGLGLERLSAFEDRLDERCLRGNATTRAVRELLRVELADRPSERIRAIAADSLLDYNSECSIPTLPTEGDRP